MNNTVNLNGSATNYVKYEVRFDDEGSITCNFELFVTWYVTKEWMSFEVADTLV
jgi:hypothetical protein